MRTRLVFASVVAAGAVAAAGSAAIAAGGFGSPGTFTFHDVSATAQLVDANGNFLFISADRGVQTFKPRGGGQPQMTGPETVLSYESSAPDGTFTGGCFVIPDSAFTVTSNLATASLNVDPSIETPCPGLVVSAAAGGRPGMGGVVPDAGGGGGGGGATITANLVWTSNGAVNYFNDTNNARCQHATAHSVSSSSSTFAQVSGTTSALVGGITQTASIQLSDSKEVITSIFSAACTGA